MAGRNVSELAKLCHDGWSQCAGSRQVVARWLFVFRSYERGQSETASFHSCTNFKSIIFSVDLEGEIRKACRQSIALLTIRRNSCRID